MSWCEALCPCAGAGGVQEQEQEEERRQREGQARQALLQGHSGAGASAEGQRHVEIGEESAGHECGFYTNKRGLALWEQKFRPSEHGVALKGALLFVHGVHEHSARYNHVLANLASELQMVVYSFDAQSHGKSDDVRGLRGAANSFDEFVDDAEEFVQRIQHEHPELPLFLWGQSFGGLVSCFVALRNPGAFRGVVLSSPAINVEWTMALRMQMPIVNASSKYTPDLRLVPAVRPEDMSKDQKAVDAYVNDPLNTIGNLRCRVGAETLKAFRQLEANTYNLRIENLLILFGDSDRCCSLDAARRFFEELPCDNKELKVFENMFHTLFHEPEQDEVIDYMRKWLGSCC